MTGSIIEDSPLLVNQHFSSSSKTCGKLTTLHYFLPYLLRFYSEDVQLSVQQRLKGILLQISGTLFCIAPNPQLPAASTFLNSNPCLTLGSQAVQVLPCVYSLKITSLQKFGVIGGITSCFPSLKYHILHCSMADYSHFIFPMVDYYIQQHGWKHKSA